MVESYLGQHALEAFASDSGAAGDAEVVIDNHDSVTCPAKLSCHLHQAVLKLRGFLVAVDLLKRGLPDVHDRTLLEMPGMDLLRPF